MDNGDCCKDNGGELRIINNQNLNKFLTFPLTIISKNIKENEKVYSPFIELKGLVNKNIKDDYVIDVSGIKTIIVNNNNPNKITNPNLN
jgi:hypothetical protein